MNVIPLSLIFVIIPICILFVQRTRDEMKFDSLERLKAQLHEDEVAIRSILINNINLLDNL